MNIQTIKTIWSENELKQNTYVVEGESSCIVIDAGAPLASVKEVCNKPIEAVFITHGHFDHIEYIEEYDKLNVPIFVNEKTVDFFNDPIKNASALFKMDMTFNVKNIETFKDNEEIFAFGTTIKCIYTPGHSEDSSCFLMNDMLFCGDTLFSIAVGRTDIATSCRAELIESLKKLNEVDYKLLYPGHGRSSTKEEQNKNIAHWIHELTNI